MAHGRRVPVESTGRCPSCDRRVVYLRHPHHRAIPHALTLADMYLAMRDGRPVRHTVADCLAEQMAA